MFAAWIKSNAVEDESDENVITRVRFVALLIHLAFKLYKLDPELHIKGSTSATSSVTSSSSKQQGGNSCEEDSASDVEIIQTDPLETSRRKDVHPQSVENNLPTLRVKKTTEINRELDVSLPNSMKKTSPAKQPEITTPKADIPKLSITKSLFNETTSKIISQPPDKLEDPVTTKLRNDASEPTDISGNRSVITLQPVTQSFVDLISDDEVTTETDGIVEKATAEKEARVGEPEKGIIVSDSLGRLIQVCVRLLSQEEYKTFSRKISKYLNYLPEPATKSDKLASFIDMKCEEVKADSKNVFLYLNEVFVQMKKFRKDGVESSSEEVSSMEMPEISQQITTEEPEENEICDEEEKDEYNEEKRSGEISGDVEAGDETTLKEVLKSFLENCQNKFSSKKLFQPHFKSILKLMNNLDPNHLNSEALKQFVGDQCTEMTADNVVGRVEAVTREIEKYLKTKKRPAEAEEGVTNEQPAVKRVCLTTLSSSVKAKKVEPGDQSGDLSLPAEEDKELEDLVDKVAVAGVSSTLAGSEKQEKTKKTSARHIRKLERALENCRQEICRLEEAEVDLDEEDEEEESNYLLCAKYKRRYMQIFNKIAKAKEMSGNLERMADKKFKCSQSRYPEINSKIEKFVNKTRQFPDFQDIKRLVTEANSSLHLAPSLLHEEAEKVFRAVGKQLKSRRVADETGVMMSYLKEDQHQDPADNNPELQRVLVEQGEEGRRRLEDFFDNFEQRQAGTGDENKTTRGGEENQNNDQETV